MAHTQYELASMLLKRGEGADHARACELFASARRTAEAFEAVRLLEKLKLINDPVEAAPESAVQAEGTPAEVGSIEVVAASAISEPRDLSAHAAIDGTVTVLFSDIEGSSAIYEKLGDLRAQEVVRIRNEIFRQQVAAHKGFEVKAMGDGFMIAFSSARRALLCAIAVQRSFATYCERHPDQPIRVRMGLHVGETISESYDFFGKAVILAARIAAVARGGQILVSSTLHDLAVSAGDLRFAPAGEKELKGLAGTHRMFEAIW